MKKIKERPILFNSEMIRAIFDGRKTQTRRVIKSNWLDECWNFVGKDEDSFVFETSVDWNPSGKHQFGLKCHYGKSGERLWVREGFSPNYFDDIQKYGNNYAYKADWTSTTSEFCPEPKWKPSIHMPRHASRILLEITDIRVERLKSITRSDIRAEGLICPAEFCSDDIEYNYKQWYPDAWKKLWNSINESRGYGWDVNPWVWVIEFKAIQNQ